jgi:hypothetical protein
MKLTNKIDDLIQPVDGTFVALLPFRGWTGDGSWAVVEVAFGGSWRSVVARRDKNQGFGFVYVDLSKALAQRDQLADKQPELNPEGVTSINFNKDPLPEPQVQMTQNVPAAAVKERTAAINQIRSNLDRLSSLHHKLHAILEDLNKITDSDKKKRS